MTNYPTSLDSFTNPGPTDDLDTVGVEHDVQHANINDAMEAVQGELGTAPSGAYATVKARLDAVQSRVFDAVTYGALVDGSTNDTAAWQAAIDACAAAGGGIVTSSKAGVSVISGALQDTSGANAQLVLPSVHVTTGEQITVTLAGPTPPPMDFAVGSTMVLPDNHLVLKSTLTTGTGSVVGVKGPTGSPGGFSNLHVNMRNLAVRTVSNPTVSAIDLRFAATVDIDAVVVDCGSYAIGALTEPTSTGSFGFRLPTNNNGAKTRLGSVAVIGFYNAYEHAEHAVFDDVSAWGCKIGSVPTATNHASVYKRFMTVHCERGIKPTGAHALDVWQFDIEHAASGWMTTDFDIDDASNFLSGFARWWAVLAGTGPHNSFTLSGGTGITTSRVGAAIGAGASAVITKRDRLVAAGGETTLTLGATPVAGSPFVWVNNVVKWPGTDYTISGAVISFTASLTAADVVLSAYETTNASPGSAALSGGSVNILDNFTRADSTTTLGSTSTGAKPWSALKGTWGISSNKAYVASGASGSTQYAVVDAAVADNITISVVGSAASLNPFVGIVFRAADINNFMLAEVTVGAAYAPKIYKVVGGTVTTIATGTSITFASGDTISVTLSGSSITVKRNGTTIVSVTDSANIANTKHGIYSDATTGGASTARLDDFSIQP